LEKNEKNEFDGQRIIFLRHEMIGLGQLLGIGHCLSQEDNTFTSGGKNEKNEFDGQRIIFLRHEMIGLGQLLGIGHCLSQEDNTFTSIGKK
jgi:copper oxidase (laccase) domain-containing protein